MNFNNPGLFCQRTKNRTASQPCPSKPLAQSPRGPPGWVWGSQRSGCHREHSAHLQRGGEQGRVCEGGCWFVFTEENLYWVTLVWLYWFPNTLQSLSLRFHQNKVVLPWGRSPSGFDPGSASSLSSNCIFTVRSEQTSLFCALLNCAFTETKGIPKGGTSAAGFSAASLGQGHKSCKSLTSLDTALINSGSLSIRTAQDPPQPQRAISA